MQVFVFVFVFAFAFAFVFVPAINTQLARIMEVHIHIEAHVIQIC